MFLEDNSPTPLVLCVSMETQLGSVRIVSLTAVPLSSTELCSSGPAPEYLSIPTSSSNSLQEEGESRSST